MMKAKESSAAPSRRTSITVRPSWRRVRLWDFLAEEWGILDGQPFAQGEAEMVGRLIDCNRAATQAREWLFDILAENGSRLGFD